VVRPICITKLAERTPYFMTDKIRIQTNAAPPAIGTYTQAVRTGNLVFVTGQTGRNAETSRLEEGLEAQTAAVFANITAVLNAAGCSPAGIIKTTLILSDMNDFKKIDPIYAAWLPDDRVICNPARTVFEASLPHGALVMLDVIATFPS
jgi:2-iminobutanoate/2-iminopropanoate deaminase